MDNLYKVLPTNEVIPDWFGVVLVGQYEHQRKSLDKKLMIVKLPENIKSKKDVPPEYLALWNKYAPFLTYKKAAVLMGTPEWEAPIPD